jgi:hypothetical protein
MVAQSGNVTPLHLASQNGHVEAVRALLDAGAAVNQGEVSGDGGEWPLACAILICLFVEWGEEARGRVFGLVWLSCDE